MLDKTQAVLVLGILFYKRNFHFAEINATISFLIITDALTTVFQKFAAKKSQARFSMAFMLTFGSRITPINSNLIPDRWHFT